MDAKEIIGTAVIVLALAIAAVTVFLAIVTPRAVPEPVHKSDYMGVRVRAPVQSDTFAYLWAALAPEPLPVAPPPLPMPVPLPPPPPPPAVQLAGDPPVKIAAPVVRNICTVHHMKKVYTNDGRSWRCRK